MGIDHSGPTRSLDYTPYKPGTGPKEFRKDAAAWPGGGVEVWSLVQTTFAWLTWANKHRLPFTARHFCSSQFLAVLLPFASPFLSGHQ